jgi:hypothetical protein
MVVASGRQDSEREGGVPEEICTAERQTQVPCGNDRKKGKGNSSGNDNSRSRFASGMTERRARATAAATTTAEADSLRE